jgi:Xaa-Pro aminopeptidase
VPLSITDSARFLHFQYLIRSTLVLLLILTGPVLRQPVAAQVAGSEFAERRSRMSKQISGGILLLKARTEAKGMQEPGWIQDPSFFYFTGLDHQPGAILALDGGAGEVNLFVPPDPVSFGVPVEGLSIRPGPNVASDLGLTSVRAWDSFSDYIEQRLSDGIAVLYIESPRRPQASGVPPGLLAVSGNLGLWSQTLRNAFPGTRLETVTEIIRTLRWDKSESEVAILRNNAELTASALLRGVSLLRPGATQREAESGVVAGCLAGEGQGPSFWPWIMSGPNTGMQNLVQSFFDYRGMNRTMQEGELVRVDVGCAGGGYGGDVGRTFPVSGHFSPEQARVWDLLVRGYLAGVESMRSGLTLDEVRAQSRAAIRSFVETHPEAELERIANTMLAEDGGINWHIHGVGIESGEEAVDVFASRSVIAYEPMFFWMGDTYYLEDMILVTPDGAEILSKNLPYFSNEIADIMDRGSQH